ncbi:MAG: glutaminase [Cyclobacteriaceae bacterium]
MNYDVILKDIFASLQKEPTEGEVASYIPELGDVDPSKFGLYLLTTNNQSYSFGDSNEKFSIQSISKVLSLSFILPLLGEGIWKRIGVEPSGDPFNSIVQLEYENGIPRNPFINAGALVVADLILTHFDNPKEAFLNYVRKITGLSSISYNPAVAESEKRHGHLNAALANMMKSYGNIHNDIDPVLDFYFHQCSIEMTCEELAKAFQLFANQGVLQDSNEQLLSKSQVKRLNALMLSCGFYDESGEFAYEVGLPGKSGVGGGIVAIHPQQFSVAVWSPRLNKKGNSALGMKTLEILTTKTGLSIF